MLDCGTEMKEREGARTYLPRVMARQYSGKWTPNINRPRKRVPKQCACTKANFGSGEVSLQEALALSNDA